MNEIRVNSCINDKDVYPLRLNLYTKLAEKQLNVELSEHIIDFAKNKKKRKREGLIYEAS